jgi:type IX secretion system PorP/SprF family membrane protein
MKIFFTIIAGLFITCCVFGQQDPQFSQNMFNQMTVNPGYAGSQDMVCINAIHRSQWMGINGAPMSDAFSFNMPFTLFEKEHGAGLVVERNTIGFNTDLDLKLAYAYRSKMKIGDGKLGLGLSLGFTSSALDASKFTGPTLVDHLDVSNDPLIPTGKQTAKYNFDRGIGAYYKTEKLYMGLSISHLTMGSYDYTNTTNKNAVGGVSPFYIKQDYNITAGYTYQLADPMYQLLPSFFVQSDGKTTTMNLNTNLLYNNRIWGGLSYRVGAAITALFGLELKTGVRFGVAYDYDTSELNKIDNGSLEVVVIYNFKLKRERLPQRYKSVRFL